MWVGEGQRERQGDAESEAGSRFWAVSAELYAGLEPTHCKIMTWAEVAHSTDWAHGAPSLEFIIFFTSTIIVISTIALVFPVPFTSILFLFYGWDISNLPKKLIVKDFRLSCALCGWRYLLSQVVAFIALLFTLIQASSNAFLSFVFYKNSKSGESSVGKGRAGSPEELVLGISWVLLATSHMPQCGVFSLPLLNALLVTRMPGGIGHWAWEWRWG